MNGPWTAPRLATIASKTAWSYAATWSKPEMNETRAIACSSVQTFAKYSFGSAARTGASGNPSSRRTMFVPSTMETHL